MSCFRRMEPYHKREKKAKFLNNIENDKVDWISFILGMMIMFCVLGPILLISCAILCKWL